MRIFACLFLLFAIFFAGCDSSKPQPEPVRQQYLLKDGEVRKVVVRVTVYRSCLNNYFKETWLNVVQSEAQESKYHLKPCDVGVKSESHDYYDFSAEVKGPIDLEEWARGVERFFKSYPGVVRTKFSFSDSSTCQRQSSSASFQDGYRRIPGLTYGKYAHAVDWRKSKR